jgi:hypothetical protein
MRDLGPSPSSQWLPGGLLLLAAAVAGTGLAFLVGARHWAFYLGAVLAALLALGFAEKLLARRAAGSSPRLRRRLKVIQGGKAYDLSNDDSTDSQRYLM